MDEENQKILGRGGIIPFLVNLLNSQEEKIQRNATLTLRNLSSNGTPQKKHHNMFFHPSPMQKKKPPPL